MAEVPARVHRVELTDRDVVAIERALKAAHTILGLQSQFRPTAEMDTEADLLAHVSGIVQGHRTCDCGIWTDIEPEPPPTSAMPIEDRPIVEAVPEPEALRLSKITRRLKSKGGTEP